MARLNSEILSPSKRPPNSKPPSSSQQPSPRTPTPESPDFSNFSINKSVQPADTLLSRGITPGKALRGTAGISAAGTLDAKRAVGYSTWDMPMLGKDAPVQKAFKSFPQARHARIRSCESVDEELGDQQRPSMAVADTAGILDNGDASRVNAATATTTPKAPAFSTHHDDREFHAEHLAKVHESLEIHSLLLPRLNALPLADPDLSTSHSSLLSPAESRKLHHYLVRCEQNLHSLLRERGSNEKSNGLREACVDVLELVATRVLGIEGASEDLRIGEEGEGRRRETERWVMGEVEDGIGGEKMEDESEVTGIEGDKEMKKKRRRQHRGGKRRTREGVVKVNNSASSEHDR